MFIFAVVQECLPAQSLQSGRRIGDPPARRQPDQPAEQSVGKLAHMPDRILAAALHEPRRQYNIRVSSVLSLRLQLLVNPGNIARIMLSVRIHLDDIAVFSADRILIAKLQGTAIAEVKHMRDQRMPMRLHDPVRGIRRRIVHDENIGNRRNLRRFQFFQNSFYIPFFIICRNNNQHFLRLFHFHNSSSSSFFCSPQSILRASAACP